MNERNAERTRELAELVKERWPRPWMQMRPVHPDTVMLGVGGAWLYLRVAASSEHTDYCAQLYGNNTGGLSWCDWRLNSVPAEEIADSLVRYLAPWLEAVQYESRTGTALEFTAYQCVSEVCGDHAGCCGFWSTVGTANIFRVAHYRHGRHVVIYANTPGETPPYVEFINNAETPRSIEMRRRFAALSQ